MATSILAYNHDYSKAFTVNVYTEDQPRYSAADHAVRDARLLIKTGLWSRIDVRQDEKLIWTRAICPDCMGKGDSVCVCCSCPTCEGTGMKPSKTERLHAHA